MLGADGDGCSSHDMSCSTLELRGPSKGRAHEAMVRDCYPAPLDSAVGSDGSPAARVFWRATEFSRYAEALFRVVDTLKLIPSESDLLFYAGIKRYGRRHVAV